MRYLWIPGVLLAALAVAWFDDDAGIRTWMQLRSDVAAAEARQAELREQIQAMEAERAALDSDPLAVERAIREELEWARPGEIVVRLGSPSGTPPDDETP